MPVCDVTRLGVHGGSMRIFLRRKAMNDTPAPVVQEMLDEELASGMLDKESYDAFTRRVDDVGTELRQMLKEMKAKGLKIAGYGAPAKGNNLQIGRAAGRERVGKYVESSGAAVS